MNKDVKHKTVFISHHHKDDEHISKLSQLLSKQGYNIRNSSIRVNPENQKRLDKKKVSDKVLQRLLRMKISWAGKAIVIIGKDTHKRPWVNWEIEQANKQVKEIVGVYARGGTEADIPPALEKYATAIKAWTSKGIISALEGSSNDFERPDGRPREATHTSISINC